MKKFKLKSGDTVKVIAGDHKGSEGKVLSIVKDEDRVLVEGVNLVSKHTKPNAQNPQGGITEKEAPIHISNVMLVEDGVAVRVGYKVDGDTKTRISKKTKKLAKTFANCKLCSFFNAAESQEPTIKKRIATMSNCQFLK